MLFICIHFIKHLPKGSYKYAKVFFLYFKCDLVDQKIFIICKQFFQEIYLLFFVNYIFSFLKKFLFIFEQ